MQLSHFGDGAVIVQVVSKGRGGRGGSGVGVCRGVRWFASYNDNKGVVGGKFDVFVLPQCIDEID